MPDSEHRQSEIHVAVALSLTIATLCVILRFVSRHLNRQSIFPDDWLILAALIFEWAIAIAGIMLAMKGLGRHIDEVSSADLATYFKLLYTGAPLYALTIVLIKLSLCFLYMRIFPTRFMVLSSIVVATMVACWGSTVSIMGLLLCDPVSKAWKPTRHGQCLDLVRFYYGLQIPNIATDVILLILPFQPISRLRTSIRQRISLGCIFLLGSLVVAFDVIRLVAMVQLEGKGSDVTWNQVPAAVWTCVEPAAAISTACLIHAKPVLLRFKHFFMLQKDSGTDRPTIDENNNSSVAIHTPAAESVHTPGANSIANSDDFYAVRRVAPSPGSIDFMAHITNIVRTPMRHLPRRGAIPSPTPGAPSTPGSDASEYEPPMYPEVIDLFGLNPPADRSLAHAVSRSGSTLPPSPCPSRASVDTVIGIEADVADA